jgi:predicted ATPase
LGETPNVAARIQGLADPDTVVISSTTYRLVHGYFACQALGEQLLKGVSEPIALYQVLQESGIRSRLEAAGATGLTPLVGRDSEVALLLERWQQSAEGMGQVVMLSDEAGIGKSRLVELVRERVAHQDALRLVWRCAPYHTNSALYPVIDHLQRLLHWRHDEAPTAVLARLERLVQTSGGAPEETVPLLVALLSLPSPERYPPLRLSPEVQKHKILAALVAWLLAEAARQPVLAVWEDLHWADPSTLELLSLLLAQVPTARLLLLLTARSEFQPSWGVRSYLTQLTLTRLGRPQVEVMIRGVTGGKALLPEVVEQVIAKTDGVPLFVEELVKMVLASGLVQEAERDYELTGPLPPLAIPATLQDSRQRPRSARPARTDLRLVHRRV